MKEAVSKKYFFLVRGHRDWNHDNDSWLGIYENPHKMKKAYESALHALEIDRKKEIGICEGEEVMIFLFDAEKETNKGMHYEEVSPKDLYIVE